MIVATAGHVDHGKTTLIKQITGIDSDTLEEEKIFIELFAAVRLSIVIPGGNKSL